MMCDCLPHWTEVTRRQLRAMSDDDLRSVYQEMDQDHRDGAIEVLTPHGYMPVSNSQKAMIGNYYRGRGLS